MNKWKNEPAAGEENFLFTLPPRGSRGRIQTLLVYLREPFGQCPTSFSVPPRASRAKLKIFYTTSASLPGEAQNILYYLRGPSGQKPHYYLCSEGPGSRMRTRLQAQIETFSPVPFHS